MFTQAACTETGSYGDNMESETNNFLNWVAIKNFKSIKDLRMDCKRVNVFIGKPNVGKLNILKGLGLLGADYSGSKFMEWTVRYNQLRQLFYDNDTINTIEISTNNDWLILQPTLSNNLFNTETNEIYNESANFTLTYISQEEYLKRLSNKHPSRDIRSLAGRAEDYTISISEENGKQKSFSKNKSEGKFKIAKKYEFTNMTSFNNLSEKFLIPPNAPNLHEIIKRNPDLWDEFARLFTEQSLELVLYDQKQEIILQKKIGRIVWQYPLFSIADTFRRFMFYITATESNKNSVIIFIIPFHLTNRMLCTE